ncbi:MAG TPA: cupin domain-containing protein [Gemmatimonadaceae bacterium]|jgi:uncharacterized RmlC-like cupin family protein
MSETTDARAESPLTNSTTPGCCVVPSGNAYVGKQNLTYVTGLTGQTAGSRGICMTVVSLPPGARAKTHLHREIETAVYVLEGEVMTYYGEALQHVVPARGGEYVYVPADMPHLVMNRSDAVCRAVVTHTAADDQAGIEMLPHLDGLIA